jgi:hypothetical protein
MGQNINERANEMPVDLSTLASANLETAFFGSLWRRLIRQFLLTWMSKLERVVSFEGNYLILKFIHDSVNVMVNRQVVTV